MTEIETDRDGEGLVESEQFDGEGPETGPLWKVSGGNSDGCILGGWC